MKWKAFSWIFNFARYTQLFGKFLFGNFRGCRIDFPLEISLTKVRLHGSLFGSLFQALGQSGRSKKRADDEQVSDELADPARRPRPFSTRPEGLKLVSFLEIKLSQMSLSFWKFQKFLFEWKAPIMFNTHIRDLSAFFSWKTLFHNCGCLSSYHAQVCSTTRSTRWSFVPRAPISSWKSLEQG